MVGGLVTLIIVGTSATNTSASASPAETVMGRGGGLVEVQETAVGRRGSGLAEVWATAVGRGRLMLAAWSADPRDRSSTLSIFFGQLVPWAAVFGCYQAPFPFHHTRHSTLCFIHRLIKVLYLL